MAVFSGNETVNDSRCSGPEPRFWKRYSGHHEFSLSVVSSFFVHLVVGGLVILILTGALVSALGFRRPPVPVVPIVVGQPDGDGQLSRSDNTRTNDSTSSQREHVQEEPAQSNSIASTKIQQLTSPQDHQPSLLPDRNDQGRDINRPAAELSRRLSVLNRSLSKRIDSSRSPNNAPTGPAGDSRGRPDGTLQQTRQNRWTLIFDTRDGHDYLRQLRALGATLAIPDSAGGYLVFRDLDQSSPRGVPEEITLIPGLHWLDSNLDSVRSLAMALRLARVPEHVIAFFPNEFEDRLRGLEKRLGAIDEENIKETSFRVVRHQRGYDVIIAELQHKQ
jgi:hypothetical protein